VSDIASPGKNFFSILLAKNGIDADRDVTWRQYPADLLDIAVQKGEIHAIADGDPNVYLIEKRNKGVFVEVASNLSGEYKDKVCCIVGARGELVRKDKPTVAALVRSIAQASDYVAENPNESAKLFAKYSPKVPIEDLRALLGTLTHNHHPLGKNLRDEVEFYARDFRSRRRAQEEHRPGEIRRSRVFRSAGMTRRSSIGCWPAPRVQRPGNWRRAGIEKAGRLPFPCARAEGFWRTGVLATAAWLALGLLTIAWPNKAVGFSDWAYTDEFGIAAIAVGALLLAVALLGSRAGRVARVLRPAGPWLVALPVLFAIWEIATAKLGVLPTPFFAPPQSLVETYIDDWRRLGESLLHSTAAARARLRARRACGLSHGRDHRLVAHRGLLGASGAALRRAGAGLGAAAARLLLLSVELCGGRVPDRARHGLPGGGAHLVGRGRRQPNYYDVARTLGASERFLVLRVGDSRRAAAGVRRACSWGWAPRSRCW
jgi:hypothetical protein